MTSDLQRLPTPQDDVRLREDGHKVLLVTLGQTATYALNPTARAIWELCDGTTTIDELADAICQVFDVERSKALADVKAVLDGLTAAGLVSWPADA